LPAFWGALVMVDPPHPWSYSRCCEPSIQAPHVAYRGCCDRTLCDRGLDDRVQRFRDCHTLRRGDHSGRGRRCRSGRGTCARRRCGRRGDHGTGWKRAHESQLRRGKCVLRASQQRGLSGSNAVPGGTFYRSYDGVTYDEMTHRRQSAILGSMSTRSRWEGSVRS